MDKDMETAERLGRRRARALPVLAILFISQQASYFAGSRADQAGRLGGDFNVSAWLVLSIVLLAALATGGAWFRSKRVRALLNDEVTRAHRTEAFRIGFLATMMGAIALYCMSLFVPIEGREAIHVLMTVGLAAALLRFGKLERRALRDA
ncbi:MAG TPA: hypothetical protein VF727_13125 [Allosphingosinicella sp.]|jgi:hypothetical protein